MRRTYLVFMIAAAGSLSACSLEAIDTAKSACASEIQSRMDVDVSAAPSSWNSYAGTGGKGTTITYSQTADTPAIVCQTTNSEVTSLTKSETTVVQ